MNVYDGLQVPIVPIGFWWYSLALLLNKTVVGSAGSRKLPIPSSTEGNDAGQVTISSDNLKLPGLVNVYITIL